MKKGEEQGLIDYFAKVVEEQLRDEPGVLKRYEQEYLELIEELSYGVMVDEDLLFIYSIRPRLARKILSGEGRELLKKGVTV